jgi:hypothetical protein
MKRAFFLTGYVSFVTILVLGQYSQLDPSISAANYKHANKTVLATAKVSIKPVRLKPVLVRSDVGFKHPFNRPGVTVQYLLRKKSTKTRSGYKHPLGL